MAFDLLSLQVLGQLEIELKNHLNEPIIHEGKPCKIVLWSRGSPVFEKAFNAYRQKMSGSSVTPEEQKAALFELMNACIIRYENVTVGGADPNDTKQITRTIFDNTGLGFLPSQFEPLMVSWEKQVLANATN
jgi:hypothetical protein